MGVNQPKMAIGFVIYGPEKSFYERLELIDKVGAPFYVYDNSPEIVDAKVRMESLLHGRYLSSGKNQGLGVGLSDLCQSAYKENFDGLLFFDQDTGFNLKTISFIQSFMNQNIGHLLEKYSAITFSGAQSNTSKKGNDELFADVDFAINSGSIFILKNLKKLGWHNKSYFVDGVDYEFCLRSHIAGFKIGKFFNTPCFDHESEQPDRVVTIFGKKLLVRRYSASRMQDTLHSYVRLIYTSIASFELTYAFLFVRSMSIYLFGQILSRLPGGRAS